MCIRDSLIAELAAPGTPVLECYNKCDLVADDEIPRGQDKVAISAASGFGLDALKEAVEQLLGRGKHHVKLLLPYAVGGMVAAPVSYTHLDVYKRQDSMDNLILLILGLFISVLGITNIKGNISTIHSYNRRKVKEEDIPKYGKVVGTGTLIMGVSFILGYIALFWSETAMAVIILPGVVVGLGFMLYGQFKYNKGIF